MDFGVVLQTDPPASRVVELAKLAEANGFTYGWTFDSHVLWQEPFVIYSRILAETERMIVGPMVTNPGTRDWTVLASLFATLNDMYGNRTICGMGRGDSALRYIGKKPRTLATMVESMKVIKGMVKGEEVDYQGRCCGFSGSRKAGGICSCGEPGTGRRRSTQLVDTLTGSFSSWPTRRFSNGRCERCTLPRKTRGATPTIFPYVWSPLPTSAMTSLINATSCDGSAGWSVITFTTW